MTDDASGLFDDDSTESQNVRFQNGELLLWACRGPEARNTNRLEFTFDVGDMSEDEIVDMAKIILSRFDTEIPYQTDV